MKKSKYYIIPKLMAPILILISLLSCQKEFELSSVIYENDFEDSTQFKGLTNHITVQFNNSQMLGNYHDGGFRLDMIDLPKHKILQFEFDLYILDTWDGNGAGVNGPDRWFMEVRKEWDFRQRSIEDFQFVTTFSNAGDPSRGLCFLELGCIPQSYPDPYPSFNFPRTGATSEMNGICLYSDRPNGAMQYRVTQTISHEYSELHLYFYDSLVQDNAFSEPCDESWALDNLIIRAFDEI